MKIHHALFVAAALIATVPALHAAPAKQVPLRDFFRNPDQAGHQVFRPTASTSRGSPPTSGGSTSSCVPTREERWRA